MKKRGKSVFAILMAVFLLFNTMCLPVFAQPQITVTDGEIVTLKTTNYTVKVDKTGFRYGFYKPDSGTAFADMHTTSGICFGKVGTTPYEAKTSTYTGLIGDTASFIVTNTNGDVADVSIKMFDHYVKFSIIPKSESGMKFASNLPQTVAIGDSQTDDQDTGDTNSEQQQSQPLEENEQDSLLPDDIDAQTPSDNETQAVVQAETVLSLENLAAPNTAEEDAVPGQSSESIPAIGESDSQTPADNAENQDAKENFLISSNNEPQLLSAAQAGGYLHILGGQDSLNATVCRLITPNLSSNYTIESDVKIDAGSAKSVGIYAHYNQSNAFHLFFIKASGALTGINAIGLKRLDAVTTVDFATSITQEGKAISIAANTWYHLKMVVQDKTVKCYLNDVLVFDAVDTAATSTQLKGGCGVRLDKTGASFDNISVTSNDGETTYTSMDFENTEDIAGWQHTKWEKMMGSSGAEHIAADGTITAVPAYDPNSNTYMYIKPSSLTAVSVKRLTDTDIPDDNYTMEARVRFENAGTGSSTGIFAHYNMPNAFHLFFLKSGNAYLKRLDATSPTLGEKAMTSIAAGKWYRMKIVAEGKSIKCYINDQLLFEGNDSTASAAALLGKCGLRVYKDYACFDDIKVYSNSNPAEVYYQNDFEGKALSNITGDFAESLDLVAGVDKSTIELKTEVRADNPDAQLTEKYLLLTANPMSSAVVAAGTGWTDYSVSADTSFAIGDEQTTTSILMRYTDVNNYYRFGFLKYGCVSLIKNVAGVETVLSEIPYDYVYDKFYNLKADLAGETITCYVDGVQVLQSADAAFSQGTAGVMANVTTAKADNFTVSGGASFTDAFDGDLTNWIISGTGVISYDGDPAQNPEGPVVNTSKYTIDARVEGNINPMYGLGDYGAVSNTGSSVRDTSNVFGVNRTTAGAFTNKDGGAIRFISNFAISPQRGFAQVLFEEADKRVVIDGSQTMLGVLETEQVTTLYYFFGDSKQIYQDYRDVRNAEGYKDTEPHYEMFGLGWEAFGALGWNAYQQNVMATVQDYLSEGYDITWAVIGSGFWKGDREGLEGTTTSFGMWDDTADPAGRNDTAKGMPNPRFPDPEGIKTFFKNHDIKMLLGLRVHFKLPAAQGGDWNPLVDGNFVNEGLAGGFFLKNEDGSLMKIHAKYPSGNLPKLLTSYIDGSNPDALEWYRQGAALWGADGFKEDTMVLNGDRTYNDGNWNRVLSYMIEKDDSVMIMRNGAYSLSGDILRINDANMGTTNSGFNTSPDRMPINLLAYAASGVSNVYPDIVGGTGGSITSTTFQKYLVRNAQFAALNPSLSVGINALKMNNEEYKAATFNAINWHTTYAPYIYDAALKSWKTGYPYSMTPLYVAYPNDGYTANMINTTQREYEWLLGESILAAPQFGTDFNTVDTRDVYLPEGKWIDYSTGETFTGPLLLENRAHPVADIPAFVGGKGVLIGEDMQNKDHYFAEVFPIANGGSTYDYTYIDGVTTSQIVNNNTGWAPSTLKVKDTSANKNVDFTYNTVNQSIKFTYEAGHNYELTGGEGAGSIITATAECSKNKLSIGQTANLTVTGGLKDDGTPADLQSAAYSYTSSDSSIVSINSRGAITAVKEGSADVWASVTLNNTLGMPVTVQTNKLHIEVTKPTVAITSPLYFADDFTSGSISAWRNLAPAGSYSVVPFSGSNALKYSGAGKASDRGILLQGDMSWKDYTVEADITIPAAETNKTVGLSLRYVDANQCYIMGYTQDLGLRYIKRNGDTGSPTVDSITTPFTMTPNQTYHFKVVAKGNTFTLYVDDDPVPKMTVTDNAVTVPVYTNGSAGTYASGLDAYFDNFKITTTAESLPFNISGTSFGTDKLHLKLWNIDTTVTPDVQGNWSYPVTYIPNGIHTAVMTVEDQLGNVLTTDTRKIMVNSASEALNKSALETAITYASGKVPESSQIGIYNGQYPQLAADALADAIAQAELTCNTATTQAALDSAVDVLYSAVSTFENSKITVNRTALINAITTAQNKLTGHYTVASKAELQTVVDSAIVLRDTVLVTQAQLNEKAGEVLAAIKLLVVLPSSSSSGNSSSNSSSATTQEPETGSDIITRITSPTGEKVVAVNVTNNYIISTDVFAKLLLHKDKSVVFNGGWYAWLFNGSDITNAIPGHASFDTRLSTTSPKAQAIKKLTGNADIANLSFQYEGELPGRATIRVRLEKYAGKTVFVYYYNPDKNRLELIKSNVKADNIGWLAFNIVHCSDYIVSSSEIEGAVTIPETGGGELPEQAKTNVLPLLEIFMGAAAALLLYRRWAAQGHTLHTPK